MYTIDIVLLPLNPKYSPVEAEGFAGMGVMVILFIAMFFIGAFILIRGLLKKADTEQASPK